MRVRRVRLLWAAGVAAVGVAAVVATAIATGGGGFHGNLVGYQEVPAVSTSAQGSFTAHRTADGDIRYRLTYRGLEGDVQQAHIHFGQRSVNGGISAFLCSNLPSPPPGTQGCPQSGTVAGVIRATNVIGPAAQGIEAGAIEELWRAIRRRVAYANVHSSKWPGGEIRAQLRHGGR
jgi:CHRD domain